MEKQKYFDTPTQVKFLESADVVDEPRWLGGIAYHNEIICGECGSIVEIDDVDEIVVLPWVSISEEIQGE